MKGGDVLVDVGVKLDVVLEPLDVLFHLLHRGSGGGVLIQIFVGLFECPVLSGVLVENDDVKNLHLHLF